MLTAAVVAAVAHPARSATDTDVLTVTATVLSACSLSGGTLNFGSYTSGQTAQSRCQRHHQLRQLQRQPDLRARRRRQRQHQRPPDEHGANRLNYQIYRNAARNAIWGTGADAQVHVLIGTQSGTVTVYGRIPANQVVPEGTYTDTVNITLTF